MPKLFIIAGCNGSGKTTASYSLLPGMLECSQFVNSDEFAKSLSPFDPEAAVFTAGRYMLKKVDYLISAQEDFGIETTLATRSLMKTLREAKTKGYTVTLLFFWLNSPELAIARVRNRVTAGGHDIPDEIIRRRYKMGISYFFKEYIPLCDRWILADNSDPPFTVVAEGSEIMLHIKDPVKYELIWSLAHDETSLLK